MLRNLLLALAAAGGLFGWACLATSLGGHPGGSLLRAGASVAIGITVAAIAYGEVIWLTMAAGALAPLAFSALVSCSLGWATAAMCLLWIAPRSLLAPSRGSLVAFVAASLALTTLAGFIFAAYFEAPPSAHGAACVFAGCCLSLIVILVPADSPIAYSLRSAAAAVQKPSRDVLERAARIHAGRGRMGAKAQAGAKWRALARLADQRATIERAEGSEADEARRELDERIEASVGELAPERSSA